MANNFSVMGRLARDCERKKVGDTTLLEFTIADDVGFGDRKNTNWWRCQLWGKPAEGKIADFLNKGQQVMVFGEVTMREWEDRDGNKKLSPEIRVNAVQLAGGKNESGGGSGGSQSSAAKPAAQQQSKPAAGPSTDYEDDIPF